MYRNFSNYIEKSGQETALKNRADDLHGFK